MRIIVEPPKNTRPDPAVQGTVRVKLSPNVLHAKAGSPLVQGADGWRVWKPDPGGEVVLFATTAGYGGSIVNVAREVMVDLQQPGLIVPCARYKIKDVDETGYPILEAAVDGPHLGLTDSAILLTPDI